MKKKRNVFIKLWINVFSIILSPQIHHFLDFVKQIYKDLPKVVVSTTSAAGVFFSFSFYSLKKCSDFSKRPSEHEQVTDSLWVSVNATYVGLDGKSVLSIDDVMRAICFSPVKGTCVSGRAFVCVSVLEVCERVS